MLREGEVPSAYSLPLRSGYELLMIEKLNREPKLGAKYQPAPTKIESLFVGMSQCAHPAFRYVIKCSSPIQVAL